MIRLKQTMGNVIKGKLEPECMISKYECNSLTFHPIHGLLSVEADKMGGLTYSGEVKRSLSIKISSGINEEEMHKFGKQIIRMYIEIKKNKLNPQKIVFHPDWIFLVNQDSELKFIYLPINGMVNRYDMVLFLRDLVLKANLNSDVRSKWNNWLDNLKLEEIGDKTLMDVPEKGNTSNLMKNKTYDIDDEPVTTLTIGNEWNSNLELDEDGEAPTGSDETNMFRLSSYETDQDLFDDDGEAKTGIEEDCIFTNSGAEDGTFFESNSEPFSVAGGRKGKRPTLLRVSTGERKSVTKDEFKLGRSEHRADFCIRDNSKVSNVHATVIFKNGKYYLKDEYSKNGTSIDGTKITEASVPYILRDGSVIRLSDEELIFNL